MATTPDDRRSSLVTTISLWVSAVCIGVLPFASCGFCLFVLFYPPLWPLAGIYLLWYIYDRETPWRSSQPKAWIRSLPIWHHAARYFDCEWVTTSHLPPDQNYVIASHPHGCFGVSTILNFATDGTGLSKTFPGLDFRVVTLPINFSFPIHRDIFVRLGFVPSDSESISHCLKRESSTAVVIVPGGAEESLDAHAENYDLTLKNRRGFVRLAIQHGASLVPVYTFGETSLYRQLPNKRGSVVRTVQKAIKAKTGIAPILINGRGIIGDWFGILPYKKKLTTVVGSPIPTTRNPDPTKEEIGRVHAQYLQALSDLFEQNKQRCGVPADAHLRFV